MKVLICCWGFNSFKENSVCIFALDQAKALRAYGYDVRICAGDVRSIRRIRPWGRWSYEIDGIKVYTANFPCGPLPSFILSRAGHWVAKRCYGLMKQDGWIPDIVHAHFTGIGNDYVDLVKADRIPFVLTEHYSSVLDCNITQSTIRLINILYRKVDSLVTVSQVLAYSINKHTGLTPMIVPNVVDVEIYSRNRVIKDNIFRFVCCSALIKSKAQETVLRAFAKLKNTETELTIMGDGPERKNLESLVKCLNITDKVKFLGYYRREQMADELAKSNCFVLASRYETFGVVYVEALAAGVPIIATDCGGPRDFVNDKVGVLVPVDDVDALASAMQDMVDGKVQYNAAEIVRYARDNFSPAVIAEKLTKVYENVLENRQNN